MKRNSLRIALTFSLMLFYGLFNLAERSFAAPSITGISGTVSDGQSITLYGSGFGTKMPAAPYFWDTVDNQSAYQGVADGTPVPIGGPNDPFVNYMQGGGRGNTPTINKSGPVLPNRSASYHCVNTEGYECGLNDLSKGIPNASQLYISWWIYPAYTPNSTSSDKIIRLGHDCSFTVSDIAFNWTTNNSTVIYDRANDTYQLNEWNGTGFVAPQTSWYNQEALIDTTAGSQRAYFYSDGLTVWSGSLPYGNYTSGIIRATITGICSIGLNNNEAVPGYQNWGDIYMDTTFQRAELCPGSTWENRGQCTMLIPATWADTVLTASVNRGNFANGAPVYLYVIDVTNTANSAGVPVIFGNTYTTATHAPAAPGGLTVQ